MATTMHNIDIQQDLEKLAVGCGLKPLQTVALAQSGSSRKYFRIFTETGTFIGTYSTNIEENEAFFHFSRHFKERGLNVPEVLAVGEARTCYLQSDLGDDNLFCHVQKSLAAHGSLLASLSATTCFGENVVRLYKKALSHLAKFQYIGNQGLDYTKAYPSACFDRQAILDDLNYFKYCFLKPHEEIGFNETRLNADFSRLADLVSQAPCEFFMYRDFQSRNIMVKDDDLYFIDFQGGRKGPLNYDVVSLLYQVKAQMPQAIRDELIGHYKQELSQYLDPKEVGFDKFQPYFVYLRLMQVLGAYGFRGLVQRKPHFIESIPYALKELKAWNEKHPLNNYAELQNVISQLSTLDYPLPTSPLAPHNAQLTITVNSFSFRKGYPADFSGNGGGFVFDCRALPNPGREAEFKAKTGRDWDVIDYLEAKPQVGEFMDNVKRIVNQSVDNYIERHFSHLMVSFGCTGGQHRSVYCAQSLYEWLKMTYPHINLKLNHIEQNIKEQHGL